MNTSSSASRDAYPYLRQCLAPQYADADAGAIEAHMDERFGLGAAEHYDELLEGFFDDLGRSFQKVAPIVANVAGGVARGAMSGSSLGLPGIIGGALVGGTGTAFSSYGKGPLRDIGNVLNTGTKIASQFSPLGRAGDQVGGMISGLGQGRITPQRLLQQGSQMLGAVPMSGSGGTALAGLGSLLGGGGSGAAGKLSSLLGRPELQQALMALMMGPSGRRTVSVGANQTPVPTTAIAGLLQSLAAQAIDEAAAGTDGAESELAYMADAAGEFIGDPAEDDDRAARVWDLLNQAQWERLAAVAAQTATRPSPQQNDPAVRMRRASGAADERSGRAGFAADPGPLLSEDLESLLTDDLLALFDDEPEDADAVFDEHDADDWTLEAAYDDL